MLLHGRYLNACLLVSCGLDGLPNFVLGCLLLIVLLVLLLLVLLLLDFITCSLFVCYIVDCLFRLVVCLGMLGVWLFVMFDDGVVVWSVYCLLVVCCGYVVMHGLIVLFIDLYFSCFCVWLFMGLPCL